MQWFTGKQYLIIDIANSFGLDKKTWNERLDWFAQNQEDILENPLAWTTKAEEPAQFLAGVNAFQKALNGHAIGYLCGLDATASGIQILSILAGCTQSGSTCNLVNTGKREDAYTSIHEHMDHLLGNTHQYTRKTVKAAGMTHFYGSKAQPRAAFGEDTPQLSAFYKAINDLLPGADMLNHELLALWQPDALSHDWTLPDGFDVRIKVMQAVERPFNFLGDAYAIIEKVNAPKESSLSLGANIVHSIDGMVVREMNRRCNYDAEKMTQVYEMLHTKQGGTSTLREKDLELLRILACVDSSNFMSLVIVDHLDEHNLGHLEPAHRNYLIGLIGSIPQEPFKLLAIHDCFKFHPNNGNSVRQQYVNILAELADSEVLSHIASQITNKQQNVSKIGNNLSAHIRNSEYALS